MSYNEFVDYEFLTAEELNNLQSMTVMRFANAAARDAAIPAPVTGQVSFVPGDVVRTYNGTAWVAGPGFVAETINVPTFIQSSGTSEAFACQTTFVSMSTADRFKATFVGEWHSTVASDVIVLRIRYAAGTTVTAAGTQVRAQTARNDTGNYGVPFSMTGTFTGIVGQYTVAGSIARTVGTGAATMNGLPTDNVYMLVERV